MKKIKIYVVGGSAWYARFIQNSEIERDMERADIVLFTGGEDVYPKLYNAETHPTTYYNKARDHFEMGEFARASQLDNVKLIVGICRGSQLACVVYGGKLIQDVDNHGIAGGHPIINKDGEVYNITSTHHQMQYPFDLSDDKYEILYWSEPARSKRYEGDLIDRKKITCEPEIVLYKGKKKTLAIQGHPEAMPQDSDTIKMLNSLILKEMA